MNAVDEHAVNLQLQSFITLQYQLDIECCSLVANSCSPAEILRAASRSSSWRLAAGRSYYIIHISCFPVPVIAHISNKYSY
jgi:hypothetical protein